MKEKTMRSFLLLCLLLVLCCPVQAGQAPLAQAEQPVFPVLKKAVMCEKIKDGQPVDQTIVFDVAKASAYCWANFDPVPTDGVVFFEWYRDETIVLKEKRAVRSRRGGWATYSSLKLRQADIGPWQVNITDENGKKLTTLRFSITE